MKWLVILIISVCTVLASSNWEAGWSPEVIKNSFRTLKLVNKERMYANSNFTKEYYNQYNGLYNVNYDYQLAQGLFDLKYNMSEPVGNSTLGVELMNQPDFKYWKRYGYKFFFKHRLSKDLAVILKKGRKCFKQSLCSKTEFHNFKTCIKPVKECTNAEYFYPRLLKASFSRIAHVNSNGFRFFYGRQAYDFEVGVDFPFLSV